MGDIEIPAPEGKKDEKQVGIIIAVIAVLMAIVGSLGNNAADDMIVGEVKSSNGYAWYQAKRQREYLNDLELRRIEVEHVKAERWNGALPTAVYAGAPIPFFNPQGASAK